MAAPQPGRVDGGAVLGLHHRGDAQLGRAGVGPLHTLPNSSYRYLKPISIVKWLNAYK